MDFMKKFASTVAGSTRQAVSKTGRQPIGIRWGNAEKRGGEGLENRDLRSRLVMQSFLETRGMSGPLVKWMPEGCSWRRRNWKD
eukprot:2613251-Amphidinium_carterae.6